MKNCFYNANLLKYNCSNFGRLLIIILYILINDIILIMFKNYQFFIPRIEQKKKKRIPEIDFVRGICIILMIFDHFFYDFAYMIVSVFGFNEFTCQYQWLIDLHNSAVFYRTWDFRASFRYGVLAMFLISSGFSTNFSRNNLKRGYFITIVGAFLSIGSYMLSYMLNASFYMTFGTILAIGSCILIYAIYLKIMQKFDKNNVYTKYISMIIGLIIIFIGYFGINYFANNTYDVSEMSFLNFLGSVIGSLHVKQDIDWLCLFPYLGFMFAVGGLGSIIYKDKIIKKIVISKVYFNKLTTSLINKYLNEVNVLDKAGSYAIQDDKKYHLIKKIEGSYYNIVGFPLEEIKKDIDSLINE